MFLNAKEAGFTIGEIREFSPMRLAVFLDELSLMRKSAEEEADRDTEELDSEQAVGFLNGL